MTNSNEEIDGERIIVKDSGVIILPDCNRVIVRPNIPINESRNERIISRILSLDDATVKKELESLFTKFAHRHHKFETLLERQYAAVHKFMPSDIEPTREKQLLIGSYFWSEFSYEAAALFNPSIMEHPDQLGLPEGSLRFILSLRATGEGHISSLAFRSGIIDAENNILMDQSSSFATAAEMKANILFNKTVFEKKLREMDIHSDFSHAIIDALTDEFTFSELKEKIKTYIYNHKPVPQTDLLASEKIQWLAQCNYETHFDASVSLSERVIFPLSPSEQNGIEDARFVRFTDDDGSRKYYATYTAYDGKAILPQLMETENFEYFKMITLNGNAAVNKGMALFPRRINGSYAMISRQDSENLFIMYSDNIHFWHEAFPLMKPSYPWEFLNIGNCGSPIETEHGWLLLTHGVGAFRQYSVSAALLDKDNPSQVIGRLTEPLIEWTEAERAGYVPNVIYTCGALVRNDTLILPYAISDQQTRISLISLSGLLKKLMEK